MKKNHAITILLLLFLSLTWIATDKYFDYTNNTEQNILERQTNLTNSALATGYRLAAIQIVEAAKTCQIITVTVKNTTTNLISTSCLQ